MKEMLKKPKLLLAKCVDRNNMDIHICFKGSLPFFNINNWRIPCNPFQTTIRNLIKKNLCMLEMDRSPL